MAKTTPVTSGSDGLKPLVPPAPIPLVTTDQGSTASVRVEVASSLGSMNHSTANATTASGTRNRKIGSSASL